ncbi:MAG: hypothetical protein U1E87_05670 [Alphaproteobacteria bacterium]
MIEILVPLAGLMVAGGVYLVLSPLAWPRLVGIALIGQALPLVLLAAGGRSPHAVAPGLVLALVAFGWFLAEAGRLGAPQTDDVPDAEDGA